MLGFGAVFARCACRPLSLAREALGAGDARRALEELEPSLLLQAFREGTAAVATATPLSAAEVEALINWEAVDAALATLGQSLPPARAAWADLAPMPGGLLDGVADVTVAGDEQDIGFCLDRLADKLARDKSLARPLELLATDAARWQAVIESAALIFDSHPRIEQALKARRLRNVLALLAVVLVTVPLAGIVGVTWLRRMTARSLVEQALVATDPCEAHDVDERTLDRAGKDARDRVDARVRACAAKRTHEARVEGCAGLVALVQRGKGEALSEAEIELAGDARAFVERLAARKLGAADFAAEPSYPCSDLGADEQLEPVFVSALAAEHAFWADPGPVAPALAAKLKARGLEPRSKGALLSKAETTASRGVKQGDAADLARGAELCAMVVDVGLDLGPQCRGLAVAMERTRKQAARTR